MRENITACGITTIFIAAIFPLCSGSTEFEGVFDDEPAHLAFVTPKKPSCIPIPLCRCVRSRIAASTVDH